jgi:hypothetical protein
MNRRRMLSMLAPYPDDQVPAGGIMADELVERLARSHAVAAWTGFGGLYGPRSMVRAARRDIRRVLRQFSRRVLFVDRRLEGLVGRLAGLLPERFDRLAVTARKLGEALDVLDGRPSRVALPLAYCRSGTAPENDRRMNPARDGCGLIWYAPLVPMKGERVRQYVELVERVCRAHGIEPLITLTGLFSGCFDSTIPILFDRGNGDDVARARACHRRLFQEGCELGFVPYRFGMDQMDLAVDSNQPCWRLVDTIKSALDPERLIAPGRYAPLHQRRGLREAVARCRLGEPPVRGCGAVP